MRRVFGLGTLVVLLLAGPAVARPHPHSHHVTPAAYGGSYYTNADGQPVHRPVFTRSAPGGASARCRDGSYSFSQHRSGTCSHHGGVAGWL